MSASFSGKKTIAELTAKMPPEAEAMEGRPIFPVADLTAGGGSKVNFIDARREAGRKFDAGRLKEVESFMRDPRGWSKAHGGTAGAGA